MPTADPAASFAAGNPDAEALLAQATSRLHLDQSPEAQHALPLPEVCVLAAMLAKDL